MRRFLGRRSRHNSSKSRSSTNSHTSSCSNAAFESTLIVRRSSDMVNISPYAQRKSEPSEPHITPNDSIKQSISLNSATPYRPPPAPPPPPILPQDVDPEPIYVEFPMKVKRVERRLSIVVPPLWNRGRRKSRIVETVTAARRSSGASGNYVEPNMLDRRLLRFNSRNNHTNSYTTTSHTMGIVHTNSNQILGRNRNDYSNDQNLDRNDNNTMLPLRNVRSEQTQYNRECHNNDTNCNNNHAIATNHNNTHSITHQDSKSRHSPPHSPSLATTAIATKQSFSPFRKKRKSSCVEVNVMDSKTRQQHLSELKGVKITKCAREDANTLLQSHEPGTFFFRESQGGVVLSLFDGHDIQHLMVRFDSHLVTPLEFEGRDFRNFIRRYRESVVDMQGQTVCLKTLILM